VERLDGRDAMTVVVEARGGDEDRAPLAQTLRDLFRRRLGVDVLVDVVAPGALTPVTGIESRQKPIRLIDDRPRA
jgi:phenylacetate-CoA ligase